VLLCTLLGVRRRAAPPRVVAVAAVVVFVVAVIVFVVAVVVFVSVVLRLRGNDDFTVAAGAAASRRRHRGHCNCCVQIVAGDITAVGRRHCFRVYMQIRAVHPRTVLLR